MFGFLCVVFPKENYENGTTHRKKIRPARPFAWPLVRLFCWPTSFSCVSLLRYSWGRIKALSEPLAASGFFRRETTIGMVMSIRRYLKDQKNTRTQDMHLNRIFDFEGGSCPYKHPGLPHVFPLDAYIEISRRHCHGVQALGPTPPQSSSVL